MFSLRLGDFRPFIGAEQRESDSAGEFLAGFTTYTDTGSGPELYDVSYVSIGGRSDHIQNMTLASQGKDLVQRRVGSSDDDELYTGSIQDNRSFTANPDSRPGAEVSNLMVEKARKLVDAVDNEDIVVASAN